MARCVTHEETVRVVHALPGRLRLALPQWDGRDPGRLERWMLLPGVCDVRADPLTQRVLVSFDPRHIDPATLCARAAAWGRDAAERLAQPPSDRTRARRHRPPLPRRVRLPVPGLEGNLLLAQRLEQALPSYLE